MDETKLVAIRTYYESLSDEALLAEADSGPDAFAPEGWTIVSEQIERRGLHRDSTPPQRRDRHNDAAVDGPWPDQRSRTARLAARIDALPPTIRPAVFGALLIVFFAMSRGALLILPIALIYVLSTGTHPWASIMSGLGIGLLAMAGGAVSGLAYGVIGRRVRTAVRGGCYVSGIVTLAPYMFVLPFIVRLSEGEPLWHRLSGSELAMSGGLTLLFGLVLGRSWFGADDESGPGDRAT